MLRELRLPGGSALRARRTETCAGPTARRRSSPGCPSRARRRLASAMASCASRQPPATTPELAGLDAALDLDGGTRKIAMTRQGALWVADLPLREAVRGLLAAGGGERGRTRRRSQRERRLGRGDRGDEVEVGAEVDGRCGRRVPGGDEGDEYGRGGAVENDGAAGRDPSGRIQGWVQASAPGSLRHPPGRDCACFGSETIFWLRRRCHAERVVTRAYGVNLEGAVRERVAGNY